MSEWGVVHNVWSVIQSFGTIALLGLATKFYLDRRKLMQSERVGDLTHLREEVGRLSDRVKALEVEAESWRARAIIAEAENARLRAIDQGQGEVRARTQEIVAADRLARAAEKKAKNGE
jgi:hypothetical protein